MTVDNPDNESEIRRDYRTGYLSIIAPRRGKRPMELKEEDISGANLANCPFERGNEALTPEIERYGNPWKIRVVENKFPELTGATPFTSRKASKGLLEYTGGYGYNEVVILSPNHSDLIETMADEDLLDWLNVLIEREEILYSRNYIKYVQIFYNYGAAGGASLGHPHSQTMAWPLLIGTIEKELNLSKKYREENGSCIYEDIREIEKPRLLLDNKNFFAVAPFGSRITAEAMIVSKRHISCLAELSGDEKGDFISALKTVLSTNKKLYGKQAFNFTIHAVKDNPDSHLHLEIYPRMSTLAGVELGQNVFVNTFSPEEYAEEFRAAQV